MKFSFRFEGGEELAHELTRLSVRLSKAIVQDALLEGGEPMRKIIARNMWIEPGAPDVKANVLIAPVRRREGEDERTFSVGIGVPRQFFYDWFQEFGTVRQGAKPVYRPAFDTTVPTSLGIIGAAMWRELAGRGVSRPTVTAPTMPSGPGRLV